MLLADVALPVPIARAFTYSVPEGLGAGTTPGARVVCPLGGRRVLGVVLAVREGDAPKGVKALARVVDAAPAVPAELLAFLNDLASYYLAPIGEVMRLALPPADRETLQELVNPTLFESLQPARGLATRKVQWVVPTDQVEDGPLRGQQAAILRHLRAAGAEPVARLETRWRSARDATKKLAAAGLVTLDERPAPDDPTFAEPAQRDAPHDATAAQTAAIEAISQALAEARPTTYLLHGVTGSGKTEVYLRAIAAARAAGKGSIVLVPEIALTPQLVSRFRARFGDDLAVLHSALTPRERHTMWRKLRSGEVDVAIGARSALFAPVPSLGLLVVDEEHDPSFKQEEGVRYHARDMAILRAHKAGGVCVLGSATPSLETEQLTRTGRATKLRLPDRARSQPMPKVEIVDLRRTGVAPTGDRRISIPLYRAIEAALAAKEQVILFLNRRGFAPSVRCESCGKVAACDDCSVALTFHKRGGASASTLADVPPVQGAPHAPPAAPQTPATPAPLTGVVRCHYCDYEAPLAARCAACGSKSLALEGLGTEKLEESLASAFPQARVARLDRDVASGKKVEALLARVRAREIDVLVGTQMVTKGHDLPNVTLVGVINADAALSIPDFRAGERAFQLLVQVAGRAGRGDVPGKVIVQTWDPDHPAIALAARHDVDAFLARELVDRRELGYPPLSRSALVRIDAVDAAAARTASATLAAVARACPAVTSGQVLVQGPAPAPIARIRNRWRFRVMLRAEGRGPLRTALLEIDRARAGLPREVRTSIDVDPVQLL